MLIPYSSCKFIVGFIKHNEIHVLGRFLKKVNKLLIYLLIIVLRIV